MVSQHGCQHYKGYAQWHNSSHGKTLIQRLFNLNYFSVPISLSALHLGHYSFCFQPHLELELDLRNRGKEASYLK